MAKKTTKKSSKPAAKESAEPRDPTNIVEVPRPARGSYNPNRPLSKNTLLLHQVQHFQQVERTLPEDRRSGHDPKSIVTEGHAAEYLRKMTAILHPQEAAPARVLRAPSTRGSDE
jgi:hypothetical protein